MLLLIRKVPLAALGRRLGVIRFTSTISTRHSNTITPPLPPPQEAPQLPGGSFVVPPPVATSSYPLARLPTTSLLRSMLLHSITASPILYKLGTKLLMMNLDSLKERSLMKWGVDKTFYTQFCAGSTPAEIATTISELRSLGLGVILAYAREAEISDTAGLSESQSQQIEQWLSGSLKTIACVEPGDFVAIKYSGAGLSSLPLLSRRAPCDESRGVGAALHEICKSAMAKGVRILIDAEQAGVQDGVHDWTLELMRRYNRGNDTKAVVYNTYQMSDYYYYYFLGMGYHC
ncbi:FAD-linked oxidoreductase-like protein [Tuber borchii]|uniref:Proline dehydrogenase n=1 Tax=Tuber borchii TaxID=42251 RepID=A0A2T6ZGG6_TUBBO|nr:FAD-linked oxidoreductase-like protein [Tuber borchii]